MKKMMAVCVLALLLSGCNEPTVDASTDESMKASLQKMHDSLPESKRQEFAEATQTIFMNNLDVQGIMAGASSGNSKAIVAQQSEKLRASLNGKTSDEIIQEAKAIQAERAQKEQQQALQEIAALQDKLKQSQQAKEALQAFVINSSRFYFDNQTFGGPRPVIELSVENKTNAPVSRAYFKGTITSPGRSVPWLVSGFSYIIKGGIEPGEKADWKMLPNRFAEWGSVKAPDDAVFTVEPIRLDGADGKVLYDELSFSEADQKRLDMLVSKYSAK